MVTVIIRGVGGMDSTIHGAGILIGTTITVIIHTGDIVRDMDIMAQTGVTIDRTGVVPANQL